MRSKTQTLFINPLYKRNISVSVSQQCNSLHSSIESNMTMNRSSGIIDTVTNTRNYVDIIFSNSGQAGHKTSQSISAFTYNTVQAIDETHTSYSMRTLQGSFW